MSRFDEERAALTNRQEFLDYYLEGIKPAPKGSSKLSLASRRTSRANMIIRHHTKDYNDPSDIWRYYPISDMTDQEVYDFAIELYCEAISMGDEYAKDELAEQLLKKNNPFLTYDKKLGEFLMQVGLLEKRLGSCTWFSEYWEGEPNESILNFWSNLFVKWHEESNKKFLKFLDNPNPRMRPKLGIKLDFKYDKENKKVIFTCPNLRELREIEREKKLQEILLEYIKLPEYAGFDEIDAHTKSNLDDYPLHIASKRGNLDEIKLFFGTGLFNNNLQQGESGYTPLHNCVRFNHYDCAKFLLERGADQDIANNDGQTPLDTAKNLGNDDMVELLLKYKR